MPYWLRAMLLAQAMPSIPPIRADRVTRLAAVDASLELSVALSLSVLVAVRPCEPFNPVASCSTSCAVCVSLELSSLLAEAFLPVLRSLVYLTSELSCVSRLTPSCSLVVFCRVNP